MQTMPSSALLVVCTIMAKSTSSNAPRRMNSGLPPRNSIVPWSRNDCRKPTSTYSSAGTAMKTSLPHRFSSAPDWVRPMAAPSMDAIWLLWPQAWAAPVSGLACGWSGTGSASNSPMMATVGPGRPVSTTAFTPVTAMPVSWGISSCD